jgi:hypothetical protein
MWTMSPNSFMAWNMFWASLHEQLSQPSANETPASCRARIGGMPLFSFMLLSGLMTTLVPVSARSSISSGSSHTLWARLRRGPSRPSLCRRRISEPPCCGYSIRACSAMPLDS